MDDVFENKKKSIPEKKREYIEHWLENFTYSNTDLSYDFNDKKCSSSMEINLECKKFAVPFLSKVEMDKKHLVSCKYPVSPILSRKRSLSNFSECKKIPKAINIIQKLRENCQENDDNHSSHFKINCGSATSKLMKSADCDGKLKIFTSTKYVNEEISSQSQCIESASSENESNDDTEVIIQDINSDTDKTISDFIEEINSQIVLETSIKKNQNSLSQYISDPSSKSTNNISTHQSIVMKSNDNSNCIESVSPMCVDNDISSTESKTDPSKIPYILQYSTKKKKQKNPKKGTLPDILQIRLGKEKSSVNLLRHQLCKKPLNTITKPFILLQIIQHLPMINENQLLKCILIDDATDLLGDLFKKKVNQYITVINVPQISCLINTSQNPILKIYQPWIVIDPNQLILLVTRFTALPSFINHEINGIVGSTKSETFKMTQEFDCPCISENIISKKCKSQFQDNSYNITKVIFNCE